MSKWCTAIVSIDKSYLVDLDGNTIQCGNYRNKTLSLLKSVGLDIGAAIASYGIEYNGRLAFDIVFKEDYGQALLEWCGDLTETLSIMEVLGMWDGPRQYGKEVEIEYDEEGNIISETIISEPKWPLNEDLLLNHMPDVIDEEGNATRPTELKIIHSFGWKRNLN